MAGGFKATADYLHAKSCRPRDDAHKRRLLDEAEFQYKLADIIPTFPSGYKPPGVSPANRPQYRAELCRTLAEAFSHPTRRRRLLDLADHYERIARAPK